MSELLEEILEITGDGMTLSFRPGVLENDVTITLGRGEERIETTMNVDHVSPDMVDLVYLYAIRELKAEIHGERLVTA